MLDLNVRRVLDNERIPVNIAALALRVKGEFEFPAEAATAVTGDNAGARSQEPAVIIHCADRRDVLECIEFASGRGLLLVMNNSRHEIGCWGDCDGGIAVDLSALSSKSGKDRFGLPSAGRGDRLGGVAV